MPASQLFLPARLPPAVASRCPPLAAQFIQRNLIPATLGNLLGGSVLVASAYACSLGSPGHALQDAWEEGLARMQAAWRERRAARATANGCGGGGSFAYASGKGAGWAGSGAGGAGAPPPPSSAAAHRSSSGSSTFQLAVTAGGGEEAAGAAGLLPARSPRRRAGQGAVVAQP